MALAATVFRNLSHIELPANLRQHITVINPVTGELSFEEGYENPRYSSLIAVECPIGNISAIGELRRELTRLKQGHAFPKLTKVLISGSSDEGALGRKEISPLLNELEVLEGLFQTIIPSNLMREFVTLLRKLAEAAHTEENGICLG